MKKVAVIFGTHPEAIKLFPVVLASRNDREFDCRVCNMYNQMKDRVEGFSA